MTATPRPAEFIPDAPRDAVVRPMHERHRADQVDDEWKARREDRAATERLTDSDPFPALYFGVCTDCGGKIGPGDEIIGRRDGGYVHAWSEQCRTDLPPLLPRETLCGRCFCYHAGECA